MNRHGEWAEMTGLYVALIREELPHFETMKSWTQLKDARLELYTGWQSSRPSVDNGFDSKPLQRLGKHDYVAVLATEPSYAASLSSPFAQELAFAQGSGLPILVLNLNGDRQVDMSRNSRGFFGSALAQVLASSYFTLSIAFSPEAVVYAIDKLKGLERPLPLQGAHFLTADGYAEAASIAATGSRGN